jgi:hypothetical protein
MQKSLHDLNVLSTLLPTYNKSLTFTYIYIYIYLLLLLLLLLFSILFFGVQKNQHLPIY